VWHETKGQEVRDFHDLLHSQRSALSRSPKVQYHYDGPKWGHHCDCKKCGIWFQPDIHGGREYDLFKICFDYEACYRCFEYECALMHVEPALKSNYSLTTRDVLCILVDADPRVRISKQYLLDHMGGDELLRISRA
jgi:hypothetical protein